MKRKFTLSIAIGLNLILLIGPLLGSASALPRLNLDRRSSVPRSMREIRRDRPTTPNKTGKPKAAAARQIPALIMGQSATLLPDGRWLLIGGKSNDGPLATAEIKDAGTGQTVVLPSGLRSARAWHSATLLSDGNVLIMGGVDAAGATLNTAELFNAESQTFDVWPITGLTPRAYHTATLLMDGHVLVIGGATIGSQINSRVEVFDPQTRTGVAVPVSLQTARQKHTASILPDGNVLLWGGTDQNGTRLDSGEIFDIEHQNFNLTGNYSRQVDPGAPYMTASSPRDGEMSVPRDSRIALRFSKPLRVETVNAQTITLTGPDGKVAIKVVPAESGMLAFITPRETLKTASMYTLSLADSVDNNGASVPPTSLTFMTVGSETTEHVGHKKIQDGPKPEDSNKMPEFDNLGPGEKGDASWRALPPLKADPGVTALAGQVLKVNDQPLPNVTLQIGEHAVRTDSTGRFLLTSIPPGHQDLLVNGETASKPGKLYATCENGVDITAGKTTVLTYTIWLPVVDTQHATPISVPTDREIVATNPLMPGLEMHIPAGVRLRTHDGSYLTSMALTPVPLNRTPIPIPAGTAFYFTPQAHDAVVETIDGRPSVGIRIIYPNVSHLPPGTSVDLYDYNTQKGWYVYGQGTVTADGRQVVPEPGVGLQRLTCNNSMWNPFSPGGPAPGDGSSGGDPVDLGTGLFVNTKTDLTVNDTIPINLARTYRQNDPASRAFGYGATHPYEMYLSLGFWSYVDVVLPDGAKIHYDEVSPGTGVYQHTATPTKFYKSTMTRLSPDGSYELKLLDGTLYHFFAIPVCCNQLTHIYKTGLDWMQDRYGNRLTLTRDANLMITKITTPNGRWVSFTYDTSNRIIQAQDNIARTLNYTYDANGCLWKVTDVNGGITEYTYDSSHRMLTVKDPRGIVYLTNEYDPAGRVARQTQADTSTYQFSYTLDVSGNLVQTDVTDPRAIVRRTTFNVSGYTLTDTFGLGKPEQQVLTSERQPGSNFILSITDPVGRRTAVTYDAQGNAASVTQLAGTTDAVTRTFTYEARFNQIASVTDPLSHTTGFSYNGRGSLSSLTDPLGHKTTLQYNPAAQLTTATDALGNATQFNYVAGNLTEVIDPSGRSSKRQLDAVGRVTQVTNPLGAVISYQYDNLNQPTSVTDSLQGVTAFTYDPNGNLLTMTDARNGVTSYIYDNMDRVTTRRDPLQHDQTYQYDLNGNLKQTTDRNGQITNFTYDALNRLTQVTYADASTTTYTYDAANRLTQVVDSLSGTITYGYDNLDRATSETTSQGSVSYAYDAAGRRTSMTVSGQPTVNYTYDNDNRLSQIIQGSATVTIAYDAVGRRTSLTFPNGVVTEYGYDQTSHLISLTYRQGGNVFGDITYDYDAAGRRTRMGGSFARSISPQAVAAGNYNAANQLLGFGSQSLTYDANGNLLSDGANTFTWDARNRLAAISGPGVNASFQYDAVGRRSSKSIAGTSTSFLYNGASTVQEQSSQSGTANILNGGIDEIFSRSDSTGTWSPVTDGLGSSLSLTNGSGVVTSEYTYGAFGETVASGASSNNTSQYTGRDNDGTGLQYNRARYYSPALQRFVSEDPIGLVGGANLYSYAGNNPISFSDPTGLDPVEVIIWNPTLLEGLYGVGGHVSYVIDGKMYSWELHGWANKGNEPPAQEYISANQQFRSGMGYVVDFGSDARNDAFKDAIKHSYDGNDHGIPVPGIPYNPYNNNCGTGLCRAVNGGGLGLPPDNNWTPWGHRDYIEHNLPVRHTYYYPYMGGRGCAEYSSPPGGVSGFFNRLARDVSNLYGY